MTPSPPKCPNTRGRLDAFLPKEGKRHFKLLHPSPSGPTSHPPISSRGRSCPPPNPQTTDRVSKRKPWNRRPLLATSPRSASARAARSKPRQIECVSLFSILSGTFDGLCQYAWSLALVSSAGPARLNVLLTSPCHIVRLPHPRRSQGFCPFSAGIPPDGGHR